MVSSVQFVPPPLDVGSGTLACMLSHTASGGTHSFTEVVTHCHRWHVKTLYKPMVTALAQTAFSCPSFSFLARGDN